MSLDPSIFVAFRVHDRRFAIPLASAREVIRVERLQSYPGQRPPVVGVTMSGGKALTVVDGGTLLGAEPLQGGVTYGLVVEQGAEAFVLLISHPEQVLNAGELQPMNGCGVRSRLVRGVVHEEENLRQILDVQQLFALALGASE